MTQRTVLVIGVGSIGERHVRCFDRSGRATVSICEVNDGLRGTIVQRYGIQHSFTDLDEALRDPPDLAVICAPAHLHIPMARQLAAAGVHLLIEKPLSTSLEDIDELREMIGSRQLTAAVAYTLRQHPLLAEMRDAIQSGRFGAPVQLVYSGGQHFPFYRPAYREIYYRSRETGGGAIQDALTHAMNAGQWLVGPVSQLVADADHQVLEGVQVEDTVHVIARHGKVMGSYNLNQYQAPNETTMTVVCENGTLRCEMHRQCWSWQTEPEAGWTEANRVTLERDDMFVAQANMFLDAVEGGAPVACTLDEGLHTLRVNLAILRSVETRTWQTIDE